MPHSKDFLDQALRMLTIPHETQRDGTAELIDYLCKSTLQDLDFDFQTVKSINEGPRQVSLEARKGPSEGPGWIFNTHLDVVPAGDPTLWTATKGDPYKPLIEGDKIYGRGASDVTLDWLCKATALSTYKGKNFRCPVIFLGTFGEERGMTGAQEWAKQKGSLEGWRALVGEPTNLNMTKDHKGFVSGTITMNFKANPKRTTGTLVRFIGRTTHSSMPHYGIDAISKALGYLSAAGLDVGSISGGDAVNMVPASCDVVLCGDGGKQSSEFQVIKENIQVSELVPAPALNAVDMIHRNFSKWWGDRHNDKDESFDPPAMTGNVGELSVSANKAQFIFEFRTIPSQDPTALAEQLKKDLGIWTKSFPEGIQADISFQSQASGLSNSPEEPYLQELTSVATDCGWEPKHTATPGCTEAGTYRRAGAKAIVFGPGPLGGNVHRPNEWNSLDQMEKAIGFYRKVIEKHILA